LVEMRALVLEVYLLQRSLFYRPVKQKQKNSSITWTYSIAYYILVIWFSYHYCISIWLAQVPGKLSLKWWHVCMPMCKCYMIFVQICWYHFNDDTRSTAIFQDSLGKLVPERLHSGFYWS